MNIKKISAVLLCFVILFGIFCDCGISEVFDMISYAKDKTENFEIPENGDEIRDLAKSHIKKMAEVKWQTKTKIDFTRSTDWTGQLAYLPGVQYAGVPYVSNRLDGDSDFYEFSDAVVEGYYEGPKTWQTMFGSDCGGAPRLTYAYSGALINANPGTEFTFDPTPKNLVKQGLKPVGDYDCSQYTDDRKISTYDGIMAVNGAEKMYECFAKVRYGDCLFSFWGNGEHIRFCFLDAKVVRNNGKIDGKQSYIRVLEQTSSIFTNNSGTKSTWRYCNFTFENLFYEGYIPLTMVQYEADKVEKPSFKLDGVSISGKVDANSLMSGIINCNYNIIKLTAEMTDSKGKAVTTGVSYPYVINPDLGRLKYSTKLSDVPAGKYHFKLTAEIGFGTKILVDEDIEYIGSDGIVVYISDNGKGNGSSPENALGNAEGFDTISQMSYKKSALSRAVEMLKYCGGTIVVCDKITIISGHYFTYASLTDFTIPANPTIDDTTVKITSVYNGVDYRKNGAAVVFKKTAEMNPLLEIQMNTEWDNIDMVSDIEYGADKTMVIACGNKKTVFGKGFNYKLIYDGEELDVKNSFSLLPTVTGGYRYKVDPGDTDLTILGGQWKDVAAGPYGVESDYHAILEGSTSLEIGGVAEVYGNVYGGSIDTKGNVSGNIQILISGGTVKGNVVLAGNGGFSSTDSVAKLTVTGHPQIMKNVLPIGANAKHNPASETVLDFTNAWSTSVLPKYNKADFTQVFEQVIDLSKETEDTEPISDGTDTADDTNNGKKPGKKNNSTIIVVIEIIVIIAAFIVAVIIIKRK